MHDEGDQTTVEHHTEHHADSTNDHVNVKMDDRQVSYTH